MNRDKALKKLGELVKWLEQPDTYVAADQLRQIHAALSSCACGGRELIAVLKGYVIREDWERFVEDPTRQLPYIYKNPTASSCIAIEAPLLPIEEPSANS